MGLTQGTRAEEAGVELSPVEETLGRIIDDLYAKVESLEGRKTDG